MHDEHFKFHKLLWRQYLGEVENVRMISRQIYSETSYQILSEFYGRYDKERVLSPFFRTQQIAMFDGWAAVWFVNVVVVVVVLFLVIDYSHLYRKVWPHVLSCVINKWLFCNNLQITAGVQSFTVVLTLSQLTRLLFVLSTWLYCVMCQRVTVKQVIRSSSGRSSRSGKESTFQLSQSVHCCFCFLVTS